MTRARWPKKLKKRKLPAGSSIKLANMIELQKEWKITHPGSAHWYRLIDYIVGVLFEEEIARLRNTEPTP